MQELTPRELSDWRLSGKEFVLVDVRETFEHEHFNIGGQLVPLGELMANTTGLPRETPLVLYCEKGIRSVIAIQRLEGLGFQNLYNLSGGMRAWRSSLDQ